MQLRACFRPLCSRTQVPLYPSNRYIRSLAAIMTSQIANKSKPLPPGVYCPVISLYKTTPRQEIDLDAVYKHYKYLVVGGLTGLILQGTNAEAVLLSHDERMELTKTARKVVTDLGLPDYPIVAGVSGQSTNESIVLAEAAAAAGANFGLLLPPSFWSKAVTKDVILGFYREVADASPIPLVIYNVSLILNLAIRCIATGRLIFL